MCTKYPDLFAALAAPFRSPDVKDRTVGGGRKITYITARTLMNRLDTVLGPENWWDSYSPNGEHSVACSLTIRLPDGTTVTKCDAGGNAGMADSGDDDKSGYSDAFKRAAVKFGVGRHLYGDGTPQYGTAGQAAAEAPAANPGPPGKAKGLYGSASTAPPPSKAKAPSDGRPVGGRGLFKWAAAEEKKTGRKVVAYLQTWGAERKYPPKIVDWTPEQVLAGFERVCRKLSNLEPEHASQEVES